MTDKDDLTPNPETEAAEADTPETGTEENSDPVAALSAENAQMKEQVLRLAAEMDNLRKRTEREVKDTRAYAIAGFARDMLVATDNLSRALSVVTAEARENADATTKSLIEGIEMTEREMLRLLDKNGIKPIAAKGEKFDPHRHQAMFEVPDADVPEGTIVQVVQEGFAIGERVLRPAMVGVAKGGPKPERKPEADAPNPAANDDGSGPGGVDRTV